MAETVPIPEPPGLPLLGNLGEFSQNPISDIIRLADTYGKAVASLLLPPQPPYTRISYTVLTHLPLLCAHTFLTPTTALFSLTINSLIFHLPSPTLSLS